MTGAYIRLSSKKNLEKAGFKAGDEFACSIEKGKITLTKTEAV